MMLAWLLPLTSAATYLLSKGPSQANTQVLSQRTLPGDDSSRAVVATIAEQELRKEAASDVQSARELQTRAHRLTAHVRAKGNQASPAQIEQAKAAQALATQASHDAAAAVRRLRRAKDAQAKHPAPRALNARNVIAAGKAKHKLKKARAKELAKRAKRNRLRAQALTQRHPPAAAELARQSNVDALHAKRAHDEAQRVALENEATVPPKSGNHLTPKGAAKRMRHYLQVVNTPAAFGYKGHPNGRIKVWQRYLGVTADGIVGEHTRHVCARYGVILPPRPSATVVTIHQATMQPSSALLPQPQAPALPAPAPSVVPSEADDSPQSLAADLRDLVTMSPTPANYGYRGHPSEPVRQFQKAAGITADGIFGPQTESAASRYGILIPPRPHK